MKPFPRRPFVLLILLGVLVLTAGVAWQLATADRPIDYGQQFDPDRAFEDVRKQMEFGPRVPGSEAHRETVAYIHQQLELAGWLVERQEVVENGHPLTNIVARRTDAGEGWVVLGAHYDSRYWADKDPDPARQRDPVPGANDGGSGVAVLLELARVLPASVEPDVWLVFFDGEDNGGVEDWDWILGSRAFVKGLEGTPDAAVIVDMVGDRDLEIFLEQNSDLALSLEIWQAAASIGYSQFFIPLPKYRILDDHIPFIRNGIRAVDIIDFDYPYHHTVEDTLDKVSPQSLQIVGETLLAWLNTVDLQADS